MYRCRTFPVGFLYIQDLSVGSGSQNLYQGVLLCAQTLKHTCIKNSMIQRKTTFCSLARLCKKTIHEYVEVGGVITHQYQNHKR